MDVSYRRVKLACYTTNITLSVVSNLPPLLFMAFRSLYGISYSLLGLLVLVNYVTQLLVDLLFSFWGHKFNITLTVKFIPIIAVIGLLIYSFCPLIIDAHIYTLLLIGTVIFSAAGGLAEVLISPVIAAIPAKDPDREMSKLHSIYAWGVVAIVIITTVFIAIFGIENWFFIGAIFAVIPLCSALLFSNASLPEMQTVKQASAALKWLKNKSLWVCVIAIFLGGAAECTMAQWASGYLEQALGIPKLYGDIFGVALFAVMLGTARTLYSKYGRNIEKVLFISSISTVFCYLVAVLSGYALIGLVACALTGFCTGMLWPGNLTIASSKFPTGGVFIFAIMAAGGDLGASFGPQLVGIITDIATENQTILSLANSLSLSPDQLGMKLGLLIASILPILGMYFQYKLLRSKNNK